MQKTTLSLLLPVLLMVSGTTISTAQSATTPTAVHTTTGMKTTTTKGAKPKTTSTKMTKTNTTKPKTAQHTGGVQGHIMTPNTTGSTGSTGATGSSTPTTGGGKVIDVGNGGGNTGNTTNNGGGGGTGDVLQSDAANAIKQALINGITNGVSKVSVTDGYYGNPAIKIPLPQEIEMVDEGLRMVGAGQYVDKLVLQINRSAEQSAVKATPIFINSISQLTITDAVNIVSGQQPDAATQFLKRTTTDQLVTAFKPSVRAVLDKTYTTDVWNQVTTYYNKIPFVSPVSTDLPDYVTRKALDGLFYMIAQEEAKIRKDPAAQGSNILGKVFGAVLKK